MVKKVKLPAEAISFIRRQLASGDTLASYLLELPLENGTVQVYLPDAVDHSQLSLQFGGLSKFNLGEDLRMPVIAFISQFLGMSPNTWQSSREAVIARVKSHSKLLH